MKLDKFLQAEYKYNPNIKENIKEYIEMWDNWYKGNVKDFHKYYIYNGQRKVDKKRYTLNMAKQISEDWSDILWSEKCKIAMKDVSNQNEFDKLLNELDINVIINNLIEKSGALGTCGAVISVYNLKTDNDKMILDVSEGKTRLDIVDPQWIFPITWDNKEITECAFGSAEYRDGKKYIVLSVHLLDESKNYVIHNHIFEDNKGNLKEIEQEEGIATVFETKSNVKWFSIFKPLLSNNLFSNSPFGIPHYANAIDSLKSVDICYDAIKNEIKDGRKRTFVRADMLNYSDGNQRMTFDPEDTDIYVLPSGATKDDLIKSDTETLRTTDQINALNTNLNILGHQVGFGENHYHFDGTNLSTATAVVSSNSKLFRRKKKLEIGYESAIYDLVKGLCYASTTFGAYNINSDGMAIQFDDSVMEDTEAISNRAMREVAAGLISKVEYRMRVFGETREIAEEAINTIKSETPTISDLVGE